MISCLGFGKSDNDSGCEETTSEDVFCCVLSGGYVFADEVGIFWGWFKTLEEAMKALDEYNDNLEGYGD
jgi:hypothetical protein